MVRVWNSDLMILVLSLTSVTLDLEETEAGSTPQKSSIEVLAETSGLFESLEPFGSINCLREGCLLLGPAAKACPFVFRQSGPRKPSCMKTLWAIEIKSSRWKYMNDWPVFTSIFQLFSSNNNHNHNTLQWEKRNYGLNLLEIPNCVPSTHIWSSVIAQESVWNKLSRIIYYIAFRGKGSFKKLQL